MKTILYYLSSALLAVLCLLPFTGCEEKKTDEMLSATLSSTTVRQGEVTTVTVEILSGDHSGGLTMHSKVYRVTMNPFSEKLSDKKLLCGSTPVDDMESIAFSDHGRRDFNLDGMESGTYRVEVVLIGNGNVATAFTTVVVLKPDGSSPDDNPDDDPPGPAAVPVPENVRLTDATETTLKFAWNGPSGAAFDWVLRKGLSEIEKGRTEGFSAVAEGLDSDTEYQFTVRTVTKDGDSFWSEGLAARTKKKMDPAGDHVESFTLPDADQTYGKVCVGKGGKLSFTPAVTPGSANPEFSVSTNNGDVVKVETDGRSFVVTGLKPGYATVSVSPRNGQTRTFPVLVYADVTVTVEFLELDASDVQIATKTFPCYLRFTTEPEIEFDSPILWNISMKSVINVDGKDTKSVSDKTDIRQSGDRPSTYDITANVLIPSYNVYRTPSWSLSLTLTLQRTLSLDPDIWRITWNDRYLTQEARIKQYITDIQQ